MKDKKALEINDFVELLLATLANEEITMRGKKTISLPVQYKTIIEKILNTHDEWEESFSVLIDIEDYSKDHFAWEKQLSSSLKQFLVNLNKTFIYDFEYDRILITFTEEEIKPILSKYTDETLISSMRHFSSLLVDYCYTREYQAMIYKYNNLNESRMGSLIPLEIKQVDSEEKEVGSKNKVKSLFKKNK